MKCRLGEDIGWDDCSIGNRVAGDNLVSSSTGIRCRNREGGLMHVMSQ